MFCFICAARLASNSRPGRTMYTGGKTVRQFEIKRPHCAILCWRRGAENPEPQLPAAGQGGTWWGLGRTIKVLFVHSFAV